MDRFSRDFLSELSVGKRAIILALYGELGSGKTAFTKSLARVLGIKEEVNSPTFVIEKFYKVKNKESDFKKLIHIDSYRLKKGEDLLRLGFNQELKNKENLIVIEWADIVESVLPKEAIKIWFNFIDENTREIVL